MVRGRSGYPPAEQCCVSVRNTFLDVVDCSVGFDVVFKPNPRASSCPLAIGRGAPDAQPDAETPGSEQGRQGHEAAPDKIFEFIFVLICMFIADAYMYREHVCDLLSIERPSVMDTPHEESLCNGSSTEQSLYIHIYICGLNKSP